MPRQRAKRSGMACPRSRSLLVMGFLLGVTASRPSANWNTGHTGHPDRLLCSTNKWSAAPGAGSACLAGDSGGRLVKRRARTGDATLSDTVLGLANHHDIQGLLQTKSRVTNSASGL